MIGFPVGFWETTRFMLSMVSMGVVSIFRGYPAAESVQVSAGGSSVSSNKTTNGRAETFRMMYDYEYRRRMAGPDSALMEEIQRIHRGELSNNAEAMARYAELRRVLGELAAWRMRVDGAKDSLENADT